MKKGIHPKWHKNVKVMHNGKQIMTVGSTVENLQVEIWAGNHPFYTGKQTLVDTDNRVDSFNKKIAQKAKASVTKSVKKTRRRQRKTEKATQTPVTLKDMLANL